MPTDEEVICAWMEPKPEANKAYVVRSWWRSRTLLTGSAAGRGCFVIADIIPRTLTLDALHEVEARLTDEHWVSYLISLVPKSLSGWTELRDATYATAEQKVKALAAVIRAQNGTERNASPAVPVLEDGAK